MPSGLFRHLRNYASAGVLSMAVGVATFPILTRTLTVEQYGILGLVTSSLTLFVAVGKLGVQQSLLRFFAAARQGNGDWSVREMHATVAAVFLALALITTAAWLVGGQTVLPRFLQFEGIPALFVAAAGIVFVRLIGSGIINFLRAEQRSADVARAQILSRLSNLLFILALLLFGELDPRAVLLCILAGEILAMGFAASRYQESFRCSWRDIRTPLVRALLLYGLPLMMLESLGLVLRLSDRYLIEAMLGVEALGQYSASYNLVGYLDIIVLGALVQAVRPMYMQIFEAKGVSSTQAFLGDSLRTYLVLGLPFVALFSLVSPHLLAFLAGEKYAAGTVVIPFITFSFLLEGTMHFLAAGLYLNRNTRVLMVWGAIATVINLGLNAVLIPTFGLVGAASVTILSYAVFLAGVSVRAFRDLAFPLYWREPLLLAGGSLAVWWSVDRLSVGPHLLDATAKGALGALLLIALLLLIDAPSRAWTTTRWTRLRAAAWPTR